MIRILVLVLLLCAPLHADPFTKFVRGDVNGSGALSLQDPIVLLNYLFAAGPEGPCLQAMDVDGNGSVGVSDPVYIYAYMFQGGTPPPPPFPACGYGGFFTDLTCNSSEGCQ